MGEIKNFLINAFWKKKEKKKSRYFLRQLLHPPNYRKLHFFRVWERKKESVKEEGKNNEASKRKKEKKWKAKRRRVSRGMNKVSIAIDRWDRWTINIIITQEKGSRSKFYRNSHYNEMMQWKLDCQVLLLHDTMDVHAHKLHCFSLRVTTTHIIGRYGFSTCPILKLNIKTM